MKGKYWRLLRYALQQWHVLVAVAVLTVLSSALLALQPWPMKVLVDSGFGEAPLPAAWRSAIDYLGLPVSGAVVVLSVALAQLALFALNSAVEAALTVGWTVAGQRMVFKLTVDLFHRLQRLSLLFHSRRPVGDSLSRLSEDTWSIYTLTAKVLISPAQQMLVLAMVGTIAYRLDRELSLVAIGMAPFLGASSFYFGRQMKRRAKHTRQAQSRLTSFIQQTMSSIPVIQSFGSEARNRRHFQVLADDVTWWAQRGTLFSSSFGMANGLITTTGMAIIMFAGANRVFAGQLSLGSLLVFLAYIKSLQQASESLWQIYGSLKPVEAGIDRVLEILDTPETVADQPHAKPLLNTNTGAIHVRLEQVAFGFEPGRPVLRDVNLEAHPGEMVALVGVTGAGKSTLVSLVPRFFDPWSGCVRFNGEDLRELRLADVRARVAVVLQEPFLLRLSVADNIAYGRPGASRAQIIASAEAANADEFIRQLPHGYDTEIGERGATLSGGQRQRISIARALLKDAPVLILDEPTSALDAATEAVLLDALNRLMAGRSVFVIAHRLSTVRRADRIAVLEHGAIVETGTHDQLLAARGVYHGFHALQFEEPRKQLA